MRKLLNALPLLIAIALLDNGFHKTTLQEHQARDGWVWGYEKYKADCPSWNAIALAQQQAQKARRGIWVGNPIPPWEWRRYEQSRNLYKNWYYVSQILIIFLSGITPIILIPDNIPKIIPGITAGLAAAIAGAANTLKLREKYALAKITAEKIRFYIATFEEENEITRKQLIEPIFKAHLTGLQAWEDIIREDSDK